MESPLHPTVKAFKDYINNHPELCRYLKSNPHLLQTYYEKWQQEEKITTPKGKDVPENSMNANLLPIIQWLMTNIDPNKLQHYVKEFSTIIQTVQKMLQQFQTEEQISAKEHHLFHMFKD